MRVMPFLRRKRLVMSSDAPMLAACEPKRVVGPPRSRPMPIAELKAPIMLKAPSPSAAAELPIFFTSSSPIAM